MIDSRLLSSFESQVAVIADNNKQYTYGDLLKESCNICNEIKSRSLVFCLASNQIGSLCGYLAFILNDIVPVMLDSNMDKGFLNNLIEKYQPEYIWLPKDSKMPNLDEALYEAMGYSLFCISKYRKYELHKDLALLLTTSGSTGSPKFVKLTYQNIFSNASSISKYLEINNCEKAITLLPMHYSFGLSIINSHIVNGATILLTDKSLMEREFWQFLQRYKATSLSGVPYSFEILNKLNFFKMNLPYLKTITQAGGRLSDKLREKFSKFCLANGKKFFIMYGQTEATARMSYLPPEYTLSKTGSIGLAIPGGEFSIVEEGGGIIKTPETVGELVYQGENVSMGYATGISSLKQGDENQGVLATGDLAKVDKEGFYYIVGRRNRFVKIFGNRVNLDEVEHLVRDIASECACVSVEDKLHIYITDIHAIDKVKAFVSSKIGIHFTGFKVKYIDEIPKSSSGKVNYIGLKVL